MVKQNEAEKLNKQSKGEGLILKKDVKWGNSLYKKGKRVFPDRQFQKYLINNALVEGANEKPSTAKQGEQSPDVRTRPSENFGTTKNQ